MTGKQHSEKSKKKTSQKLLGRHFQTDESKKLISKTHKGRPKSEEHKRKLRELNLGEKNPVFGKHINLGELNYMYGKRSLFYNKKHSEIVKKIISEKNKGKRYHLGCKNTTEMKENMSQLKKEFYKLYPEKLPTPNIGKHEKEILDKLENQYHTQIIRQYPVEGYFIDGYSPELNTVFEVDENHHFDFEGNLKTEDIQRQQQIVDTLGCQFIRIKDN